MGLYAQIDCSFPDRAEVAEVGDLAELVYIRTVLRCREYLTDGVVDKRLTSRWYAGVRGKPQVHLEKLVAVGLLEHHPLGWRIPLDVWSKWNPTKAEVQDKREEEAERKREYRERKRREKWSDVSGERPNGTSPGVRGASGVRPRQPEPKPEPEPEPKPEPKPEVPKSVKPNITTYVPDPTLKGFQKP